MSKTYSSHTGEPLRIVFMGTPDFAAHILDTLCACSLCEVVAVYSQPDRPAGRGKKIQCSSVKILAQEKNIPVYQPVHFKQAEDRATLAALRPHVLVVAAYGCILPQEVLDIATYAPINVHASLLPLYRGAAPIQRAIMDNRAETGVSIMRMEAGLDSGPVYATRALAIGKHTADSMHTALAQLGSEVLVEVLQSVAEGRAEAVAQDINLVSHAPKMRKEEGIIDWNRPAELVDAHIRGVTPWPGAQASFRRISKEGVESVCHIRIVQGEVGPPTSSHAPYVQGSTQGGQPGQIWRINSTSLAVSTADCFYILHTVRPLNKKDMPALDFANGYLSKGSDAALAF